MEKELICVVCPVGCMMKVTKQDDGTISVEGNTCPRGKKYAIDEFTDPKRVVTSSVWVEGGTMPLVSVRTEQAIPKRLIGKVLGELKAVRLNAPVKQGQVIIHNAAESGIDVIATRSVEISKSGGNA